MLNRVFISFVLILILIATYAALFGQKRESNYDVHCRAEAWCKQSTTAIKQDACYEADYYEEFPSPYCSGEDDDRLWWIKCIGPISGYYFNWGQCSVGWNAMVDVDYWQTEY